MGVLLIEKYASLCDPCRRSIPFAENGRAASSSLAVRYYSAAPSPGAPTAGVRSDFLSTVGSESSTANGPAAIFTAHAVLVGQFRWYPPRVPAGETSAIFKVACGDNLAVRVGDGDARPAGPAAVDEQIVDHLSVRPHDRQ